MMDEKFNLDSIDKTFTRFKVGAKVNATVVAKLKSGLLVNIGGKKDGFIPFGEEENNAIQNVGLGDSFEAIIVNTRDENGAVVLSKQKADDLRIGNEIANTLTVGGVAEIIITSVTKSGLLSKLGTFEVFVPYSQISLGRIDNNLQNYVNKQFKATVLEIDLIRHKIVASIRAFEENEKLTKEEAFFSSIFENKVVTGKVVRFTDFGAFVNVNGVDCLCHNSEISFERNKKASDVLTLDESYEFKVIKVDRDTKKVSLSYKALQQNPIVEKLKAYKVGDVVNGEVKKILPFGAIISFGDGLEGLLHVKEASHFYIKNIYEVAKVGQKFDLQIIDIDLENTKVFLSLKALQEEPDVLKLKEKENFYAETVASAEYVKSENITTNK
jgi:small subunit ribosomal protein S1